MDKELFFFGSATGDTVSKQTISSNSNSSVIHTGRKLNRRVRLIFGSIAGTGTLKIQTRSLETSGDFTDESQYAITTGMADSEKQFATKLTYPYTRLRLETSSSTEIAAYIE